MYPYHLDNEYGGVPHIQDLSVGQQVFMYNRPARIVGFEFLNYVRLKFNVDGREETVPVRDITTR